MLDYRDRLNLMWSDRGLLFGDFPPLDGTHFAGRMEISEGVLAEFAGLSADGDWVLEIRADDGVFGIINDWCIVVSDQPPPQLPTTRRRLRSRGDDRRTGRRKRCASAANRFAISRSSSPTSSPQQSGRACPAGDGSRRTRTCCSSGCSCCSGGRRPPARREHRLPSPSVCWDAAAHLGVTTHASSSMHSPVRSRTTWRSTILLCSAGFRMPESLGSNSFVPNSKTYRSNPYPSTGCGSRYGSR